MTDFKLLPFVLSVPQSVLPTWWFRSFQEHLGGHSPTGLWTFALLLPTIVCSPPPVGWPWLLLFYYAFPFPNSTIPPFSYHPLVGPLHVRSCGCAMGILFGLCIPPPPSISVFLLPGARSHPLLFPPHPCSLTAFE